MPASKRCAVRLRSSLVDGVPRLSSSRVGWKAGYETNRMGFDPKESEPVHTMGKGSAAMKVLCMYDGLYKNWREQIEYSQEYASKFTDGEVVVAEYTDPDPEVDFIGNIYRLEHYGPEPEPVVPAYNENDDAEVLAVSFSPVSGAAMDAFKNLRVIGISRTGTENVNIPAATERGILVVNAAGRNANAVSDYTIGLMLAESRNIARQHALMKNGGLTQEFSNNECIPDMEGKTVGLFGFGYIGKLVAEKLSGFHVRLIAVDPFVSAEQMAEYNVEKVDLERLCKESDFLSIHARQNKDNWHTFGKEQFAMMKPTSYFINTARASMVDYDALVDALKNHVIAGAAVDVYPEMPLAEDDPIRSLDNITLSAHLAGSTRDAVINSWKFVFQRTSNIVHDVSQFGALNPEVLEMDVFKEWKASRLDSIKTI